MTVDISKYPLDLTASSVTNRVDKEHIIINDINDRIVTLDAGIFFNENIKIEDNTGILLKYKTDYIFNYLHVDVVKRSGIGAYAVVVFLDETITGDFYVTYQAVGGEYTSLDDTLAKAIEDINTTDTVVKWANVINKPLTYPPSHHQHLADDIVGMEDVVYAIESIADAVRGEHPKDIEDIYNELNTKVTNLGYRKINQVENLWILNTDNPLRVSAKPFPSAIVLCLDIWQCNQGYSSVEVSAELNSEGQWCYRKYMLTKGNVPEAEFQLYNVDGASAELFIRSTSSATLYITPSVVKYLKHKPQITSISCLAFDTIGVPIPDDYETVKPIWTN